MVVCLVRRYDCFVQSAAKLAHLEVFPVETMNIREDSESMKTADYRANYERYSQTRKQKMKRMCPRLSTDTGDRVSDFLFSDPVRSILNELLGDSVCLVNISP